MRSFRRRIAATRTALLLAAFAASILLLLPSSAYAKDIKDGFTYETGNLKWEETFGYGEELGATYSYQLGEGVRITGYRESAVDDLDRDRLVIPDTIDGKKVLWVDFDEGLGVDQPIIDVSHCNSLQVLGLGRPADIVLSNASSLKALTFAEIRHNDFLDLSRQTQLRHITMLDAPQRMRGASQNLVTFIHCNSDTNMLDLSDATKLELLYLGDLDWGHQGYVNSHTLRIDDCRSLKYLEVRGGCLTSFDPSKYPNLEYLDLEENYIADTSALEAWGNQPGHTALLTPQNKVSRHLPSTATLDKSSFVFDGQPKEPKVQIPDLKQGVDYDVVYLDNVNPGTAKAVIYGLSHAYLDDNYDLVGDSAYRGSVIVKTFTITKPASPSNQRSKPQATPPTSITSAKTSIADAAVTVKDKAYTGKTLKPSSVVVKVGGKTLKKGADYAVACKGGKKIGSYTVKITGKGSYTGTATAKFKIVPKGVAAKKPSAAKRGFTAKWKRPASKYLKQTTGYEVMWSTDKKFKKAVKSKLVKGAKKTSLKVTKLKAKKTYYVKVRAYKQVGKTKYYSDWSKVQKVKTKK